jgi:LPXTG-motif cell wall-anchored protein
VLVLNERVTWMAILGAALILGGLAYIDKKRKK